MLFTEFVEELEKRNYTFHKSCFMNKNQVVIELPNTFYKLKVRSDNIVMDELNDKMFKADFEFILVILENIKRD